MKAALYARVSSQPQAEKFGLRAQQDLLTELAEREGLDFELFVEAASGETIAGRPVFQALLQRIEAGEFQQLVVVDFDRISRSSRHREWAMVLDTLAEADCIIRTPTGTVDPSDEDDALIGLIFGGVSAREKRKAIKRMYRGRQRSAAEGNWVRAIAIPYGYCYETDGLRLVMEPAEADVVREVFERSVAGDSSRVIAKDFRQRDIPTKRKATWASATICNMLRNEAYLGEALCYGQMVSVPQVIAPDLWARANDALSQRTGGRRQRHFYLLSCCRCICRGPAYGVTLRPRGKEYRYYRCSRLRKEVGGRCERTHWDADLVDEFVWEDVKEHCQQPDLLHRTQERVEAQSEAALAGYDMTVSLQELDEQGHRLIELRVSDQITAAEFDAQRKRLSVRKALLRDREAQQRRMQEARGRDRTETEELLAWLAGIRTRIEELDREERKEVVASVVAQVRLKVQDPPEVIYAVPER